MPNIKGQSVVIYPPTPPFGTTGVNIYADDPLELSVSNSPHTKEYVITNNKTFVIQSIHISGSKDPSEKGSRIEVFYYDGSTDHLVARYHASDHSLEFLFSDLSTARDNTVMVGNGSTKKIKIKRTRLSSPVQEVDVYIEGYEE